MSFQRTVQTAAFLLFLVCVLGAGAPGLGWLPADLFALIDPVLLPAALLADRLMPNLLLILPLLLLFTFTLIAGRFFCSHLCPLGTLQDAALPLLRPTARTVAPRLRRLKYLLLLGVFVTASAAVFTAHWFSPISLSGRFVIALFAPAARGLIAPLPGTEHLLWPQRMIAGTWFVLALFLLCIGLVRLAPRFWCRAICPAGALLALFSRRPLFRRSVSPDCTRCGRCRRDCPMQAIDPDDPALLLPGECTQCGHCAGICPVKAVTFPAGADFSAAPAAAAPVLPQRRALLLATAGGALLALAARNDPREYWGRGEVGRPMPAVLLRPPGSPPEPDFLNLCIRCGLCIQACPTNMLQPALFQTGFSGAFAPLAMPRRGPCDPLCARCGEVCPTGAVPALSLEQKTWAKMGTAALFPHLCLAWEFDRACLVCDEACPYDAIELRRLPGHAVAVPFVREDHCAGCGYCEHRCPVQALAAIRVTPMAALRLGKADYRKEGRASGLDIRRAGQGAGRLQTFPQNGPPGEPTSVPGPQNSVPALPPGFSD